MSEPTVQNFFSVVSLDQSFSKLKSVNLLHVSFGLLDSIMIQLIKLPNLSRLLLRVFDSTHASAVKTLSYSKFFECKQLEVLNVFSNMKSFALPYSVNKEDTLTLIQPLQFLRYLNVQHLINMTMIYRILQLTPSLLSLCIGSIEVSELEIRSIKQTNFKFQQLERLVINDSSITSDALISMLNVFDCQLKYLHIGTRALENFVMNDQWIKAMKTRFSRLKVFKIRFISVSSFTNSEKNDVRSSLNFIGNRYWEQHQWEGRIHIQHIYIECSFKRKS